MKYTEQDADRISDQAEANETHQRRRCYLAAQTRRVMREGMSYR